MVYEFKSPLLGFEDVREMEFVEVDEMFAKVRAVDNPSIEITLVNPYILREYSFEIPVSIQTLLELKPESKVRVFCVVVLQNPLEESRVNFLAPVIFNDDNHTAAQIALSAKDYPSFNVADKIASYVKE